MAGERIQIAVRLDTWLIEAIKKFAERNGKDFSGASRFLLEDELNRYGYFRGDYEPDIVDFAMTDDVKNPYEKPSEREKRLEFELKKRDFELKKVKETVIGGMTYEELLKNEATVGFIISRIRGDTIERIKRLPPDIFKALVKIIDDLEDKKSNNEASLGEIKPSPVKINNTNGKMGNVSVNTGIIEDSSVMGGQVETKEKNNHAE